MRIYQQLLEEKISISPSELFTLSTSQHKGIRVNCSFAWSQGIEQALGVLVRVLTK
ncbi:hypothetical protein HPSNAG_1610 [Glaesserella parasuis str. Nagasaki]|nr:hypothetical protein HPSNAG_1610 [Glaesserella parasuis str. Nagasaki]